jgi:hypothetical protein
LIFHSLPPLAGDPSLAFSRRPEHCRVGSPVIRPYRRERRIIPLAMRIFDPGIKSP